MENKQEKLLRQTWSKQAHDYQSWEIKNCYHQFKSDQANSVEKVLLQSKKCSGKMILNHESAVENKNYRSIEYSGKSSLGQVWEIFFKFFERSIKKFICLSRYLYFLSNISYHQPGLVCLFLHDYLTKCLSMSSISFEHIS